MAGSKIIIFEQPGKICTFLFPFLSLWKNINEAISRQGFVWRNAGLRLRQMEESKILFTCQSMRDLAFHRSYICGSHHRGHSTEVQLIIHSSALVIISIQAFFPGWDGIIEEGVFEIMTMTIRKENLAAATWRRGLTGFLKWTPELVLVELLSFFFFDTPCFSHTKSWKWEH